MPRRRAFLSIIRGSAQAGSSVAPATLTIDLAALAANWRLLRDRAAPAECAAVVKADAYGLGIEPVARALWAAGCRTFFVAHLDEARRLKGEVPEAIVYVLNGLLPGAAATYGEADVRPVLGSLGEIRDWAELSGSLRRRLPAALHVDTGMNRLGLSAAEVASLLSSSLLDRFEPALLMSHLVSAEDPADPITGAQIAAFEALRRSIPHVPASLANSSGLFRDERPVYDVARPGYALYGGNPIPGRPNPMRAVVRLEAAIVQVRDVEARERVGYNGTWTAQSPRRLATLSVGYGDGFPRAAGSTDESASTGVATGAALVGGVLCPMVGRVSMDLIVLDVTGAPPDSVERGRSAILIGDGLDLDEVGRRAGTIGYEILTGLGRRYRRLYTGAT